jgi:cytochrome P450
MRHVPSSVLGSTEHKANPYPFYARLRAESPVCTTRILGQRAWLVTRYDDVALVLKDERFSKDQPSMLSVFNRLSGPVARHMLNRDAPDHTRLRALVHKAFTPRLVERLRGRIERLCDDLLDAAGADGGMDLMRGYALPVPLAVIGELLGVSREDLARFHALSRASLAASSSLDAVRGLPNLWVITRRLRALVARRRREPREDLVTALVEAEEAGDRLSEDELVGMLFLLVLAGYETTVNLIGSGALALLEHPEQLERFLDEPAIAGTAVEELLRFTSPIDLTSARFAREAVPLGGATIPRGALVLALLGSANRDVSQFREPDVLDLGREPNRHLAFGQGPHFCLGAPLARLEAEIALRALFRRHPDLGLAAAPTALRWRKGLIVRGLEALPVAFPRGALAARAR